MNNEGLFNNCFVLEAGAPIKTKNFADTYLYNKGSYEKNIFNYMMNCEYIDKNDSSFEDLKFDIKKRQVTTTLTRVLESNQVKLCIGQTALPKAFKVMVAKDIRGDKSLKVFIDVTGLIEKKNGVYSYRAADVDILVAYLLSALNAKIYFSDISRIANRSNLIREGCICFSGLVYYILDFLRLCSAPNAKARVQYFSSMYYQVCLLGKDPTDEGSINRALSVSGLSERDAAMIDIYTDKIKDPYMNVDTFVKSLASILNAQSLTLDIFVDKWMWLLGTGTHFGTELYTSFSDILINAYVGCYLNNQTTIEKITGQNLVNYINELFKLGSELIR